MNSLRKLGSSRFPYVFAAGSGLVGTLYLTQRLINGPPPRPPRPRDKPEPNATQQANPPSEETTAEQQPKTGDENQLSPGRDVDAASESENSKKKHPGPTPKGPMVAVYLDENSVKKLHNLYPDTREARMRKVVLEYGPSDEERTMYEPLFGGTATVKLTGEASAADRRALVASISFAGGPVKPQALTPALDVTPGEEGGGGPLGSVVLAEQIKRAGALKEKRSSSWKGTLPPVLAHHRHFPRETGGFVKLNEPITVTGSVCRADWVDGSTTRCRTELGEGEHERRGWTPSGCSLCNTLRGSPCCDIFARWEALSDLLDKSQKGSDPEQGEAGAAAEPRSGQEGAGGEYVGASAEEASFENPDEPARGGLGEVAASPIVGAAEGTPEKTETSSSTGAIAAVRESPGTPEASLDRGAAEADGEERGGDPDIEEEARRTKLMDDLVAATVEMRNCIDYHDVFADAEADSGLGDAAKEPDE